MGGGGQSAPPPPDPVATASAQAQANAGTAAAQTALNNVNMNTPYGNSFFAQSGSASYKNPDGSTSTVPTYTQQINLSAAQQKLYDQQMQLGAGTNVAAGKLLNTIQSNLRHPVTEASLPGLTTSLSVPNLTSSYDSGGPIQSSVDWQKLGTNAPSTFGQTASKIQGDVRLNNNTPTTFGQTAQAIGYFKPGDFSAARDSATKAVLDRLAPTMAAQGEALNAQLANQGLAQGSAAWNSAQLSRSQADNDLRLAAVQVGDAEQQALFGQQATANQLWNAAQGQDFNQQQARGLFGMAATKQNNDATLAMGNFHNAAQQQDFDQLYSRAQYAQNAYGMNNAAIGANNNFAFQAGNFANAAQAQKNSQNRDAAAFANSAAQGLFGMKQSAATFGNQAREQALSDKETINNNAINQVSSLMHGGQVTNGQYQGYSPGQIGQTPISQDTYDSAKLASDQWKTQQQIDAQNNAAMWQGITGLFGMGGKMFGSDRRIKRDVTALGAAPNGLPLYSFRYVWDEDDAPLRTGHMAQEVMQVRPHAVWRTPAGYLAVDYGAI